MALRMREMRELQRVLELATRQAGCGRQLVSFACPDLLLTETELAELLQTPLEYLTPVWRADSKGICRWHRERRCQRVPDTWWTLENLGWQLTCLDLYPGRGQEELVDLEELLPPDYSGRYDVVLDTISHQCFNIPRVWRNALRAVRPGGIILHILPVNVPNQGFWNISPTALDAFYQTAGGELLYQHLLLPNTQTNWQRGFGEVPHGTLAVAAFRRRPGALPFNLRPRLPQFQRFPACKLERQTSAGGPSHAALPPPPGPLSTAGG